MKYLDIVVDNKARATDCFYTYTCDDDSISIGQKVYVTFGRSRKPIAGYVFAVHDSYDGDYDLKPIEYVDDDICLGDEIVRTCIWMKSRYVIRYIDAVNCFTPPAERPVRKLSGEKTAVQTEEKRQLTEEQQRAFDEISAAMDKGRREIFLMHGVTSSGKTEVYMQAIGKALADGKTAVMMVPEVALTREIIRRFEKRFGSDEIAVIHYKMTRSRRTETWHKIRRGEKRIVIGARSAVFAPLDNIGIIILDEEHEATYKSDMTPKYDALDVAVKRAGEYGSVVVLGSATPSVVSSYRAEAGIYKKIELRKRYNDNRLPFVEVADMEKERRGGNFSMFSNVLYERMNENLRAGRQIILFLNRRGFSTYLSCDSCGHVMKCPDCGISLTYHKDIARVKCHYCGRTFTVPVKCPDCGSPLTYRGTGTQKLEDEVAGLFPDAVFDRLDFDVASRKGATEKVLSDFRKGKTDILIGTQMIAKGLDFDNVGLVGIISADNELNIPDYRSAERTFQLITQAAGRAGRGDYRGRVVIQTFMCDNYAVKYAAANDYDSFFREELAIRKMMDYPPYTDLIKLLFTGRTEEETSDFALNCCEYIKKKIRSVMIYNPQPSPVSRIREAYRYQTIIKCPAGKRRQYLAVIGEMINMNRNNRVNIVVDVNPYSFV